MIDLDLTLIKERLAEATPGPWRTWQNPHNADDVAVETAWAYGDIVGDTELITDYLPTRSTAEFIAHAPSDLAALLAEVERLRGQIDAVREHHVPVDANYYAATVTECCSCPGPWPCPTIRVLEGGEAE